MCNKYLYNASFRKKKKSAGSTQIKPQAPNANAMPTRHAPKVRIERLQLTLRSLPKPSLYICPRKLEFDRFLTFHIRIQFEDDVFNARDSRLVSLVALLPYQRNQGSANSFVVADAEMLFNASAELVDSATDFFGVVLGQYVACAFAREGRPAGDACWVVGV